MTVLAVFTFAFLTALLIGTCRPKCSDFEQWWNSEGFVLFIICLLGWFALASLLGFPFPTGEGYGSDY